MKKALFMLILVILANFSLLNASYDPHQAADYKCGPFRNKQDCINCCKKEAPEDLERCARWCFDGIWED